MGCMVFLVKGWVLNTAATYWAAVVVTFFLGISHHALVVLRQVRKHKSRSLTKLC